MPGWIDNLILKILGTEPLIKIMYSIFFFFMGMIFAPESVYQLVASRTGVSWAWIPIFYASSFVLTDALQRVINATWSFGKEMLRFLLLDYFNRKNDEDTAQQLLHLNEMERVTLRVFLQSNSQTARFPSNNVGIVQLKRKGLVVRKEEFEHSTDSENALIEYFIPHDKWEVMILIKHRFGI
jgi:hypothetical protein